MPAQSYYPQDNDNKADWWDNILGQGEGVLTTLGYDADFIDTILNDARWAVYVYRTVRVAFEERTKAVIGYCNIIAGATDGSALPAPPVIASLPAAPTPAIKAGFEQRRDKWVQTVKNNPLYVPTTQGTTLRLEAAVTPFDPNTYQAQMSSVLSTGPRELRFRFGKAGGKIDGVNLKGRKVGTAAWLDLGRFNAVPGAATIPLAGAGPEEWEFQVRAVKRDVEIGLPSTVVIQIVRG